MLRLFWLYINTIKYLNIKQIIYRIIYIFYNPNFQNTENLTPNNIEKIFYFKKNTKKYFYKKSFFFLNTASQYISNPCWDSKKESLLWLFNLNYFDYINSENSFRNQSLSLINNWINKSKSFSNKAPPLHPYTTSLRIVNWIKWLVNNKVNSVKINSSISSQALFLSKKKEYHLMGNHLLANLKALIFVGVYFENGICNEKLQNNLNEYFREISKQILQDGGHIEQSPMYHYIILLDIIDLYNLNLNLPFLNIELKIKLKKIISKMYFFYENVCHPDDYISFFNDSNLSNIEKKKFIVEYLININLELNKNPKYFNLFKNTGYFNYKNEDYFLIAKIGNIGIGNQSGHSHADSLSFELSLFNNRFIVNKGVSTYEENQERLIERSTISHNTVTVGDKNSSVVWKSFRLANRTKSKLIEYKENENNFYLTAQHFGYKNFFLSNTHTRKWKFYNKKIIISDKIKFFQNSKVKSRIYLHPNVKILTINKLEFCDKIININFFNAKASFKKSKWNSEFGLSLENNFIEFIFLDNNIDIVLEW